MDSNPFKCQVNSIHKQRIGWFGSLETNHSNRMGRQRRRRCLIRPWQRGVSVQHIGASFTDMIEIKLFRLIFLFPQISTLP